VSARRGAGLAELLVTLVLSGVVMATATRSLVHHVRLQRDRAAQAQADEIAGDAVAILRAELGHADGNPRVLGDTAVELASVRVVAVACERSAVRLVLPASAGWWSPPRTGDSVAVMDTLTGREWRAAVAATGTQHATASCPSGGARLTLATQPPPSVPVLLLPVRVWRVVRYTAYRAGDGSWWLGERSCLPVCGSAQPVAGPLLAPAQGGWRLAMVPGPEGRPVALDVGVRTAVRGRAAGVFSRIAVASVP